MGWKSLDAVKQLRTRHIILYSIAVLGLLLTISIFINLNHRRPSAIRFVVSDVQGVLNISIGEVALIFADIPFNVMTPIYNYIQVYGNGNSGLTIGTSSKISAKKDERLLSVRIDVQHDQGVCKIVVNETEASLTNQGKYLHILYNTINLDNGPRVLLIIEDRVFVVENNIETTDVGRWEYDVIVSEILKQRK